MKIPLSPRLLTCAGFVCPGDRVADIGCDHGYLGIYLLDKGIAASIIASDLREQPLNAAIRNAEKYGFREKMSFYLSDGLRNIPRDFDCLVCAGMGADTMISILSAAPWLKGGRYRLILQCQSKRPMLRQWLHANGFSIEREALAKDGKFIYTVMEVVCHPGQPLTPGQCYISPQLLEGRSPLLVEYYQRVKGGAEQTVAGLRQANDPQLPAFEAILSELINMEEQIYDHHS